MFKFALLIHNKGHWQFDMFSFFPPLLFKNHDCFNILLKYMAKNDKLYEVFHFTIFIQFVLKLLFMVNHYQKTEYKLQIVFEKLYIYKHIHFFKFL